MKRLTVVMLLLLLNLCQYQAEENIRRIAIWNMKWLGTNNGNHLDAVEMVPEYAKYLLKTGATFFALQEIGVSHSLMNKPRCYYLDLIVDELNKTSNGNWIYIIDSTNNSQRLAYLYHSDNWQVKNLTAISPGSSFNHIRKPFMATVKATGVNCELEFVFINIHLKAFNDSASRGKRRASFEELSNWIESADLDDDVLIGGDTNLYTGESDIDDAIENIGYSALYDREPTSIHNYALGQRFDRFFASPGIMKEIISAKNIVGNSLFIDVIKENNEDFLHWFDDNISDHFPVILNVDVSEER